MNKLKNKKGITLIALVITIIVLLILAGVSIAMLTGENGILVKAENAKNNNTIAQAKEKIELAVIAAKIEDDGKSINKSVLKTELKKMGVQNLPEDANDIEFNYIVQLDGYMFLIYENGKVELINGISIQSKVTLIAGEERIITAIKSDNVVGEINWSVKDASVATISEEVGDTITITAQQQITEKLETILTATATGKNGEQYVATCIVEIVDELASITLDVEEKTIEVGQQGTITATPVGKSGNTTNVEELTFSSKDTNIAKIRQNGNIATIVISENATIGSTVDIVVAGSKSTEIQKVCKVTVGMDSLNVEISNVKGGTFTIDVKNNYPENTIYTYYIGNDKTGVSVAEKSYTKKGLEEKTEYKVKVIAQYNEEKKECEISVTTGTYVFTPLFNNGVVDNISWAHGRTGASEDAIVNIDNKISCNSAGDCGYAVKTENRIDISRYSKLIIVWDRVSTGTISYGISNSDAFWGMGAEIYAYASSSETQYTTELDISNGSGNKYIYTYAEHGASYVISQIFLAE